MNELFTSDELQFREQVRKFVQREIAPQARKIEEEDRYPRELFRKLGNGGYMGVLYPQNIGGSDKGLVYEIIISEELSAVSPALDMSRQVTSVFFGMPVFRFGTEEQKRRFLPPIIKGEKIGAIAITEPDVGSDVADMKTRARQSDDGWIIDGEKRFITNGSQADYLCLFAITDPTVHPHKGMSAFIVQRDMPGFSVVKDYQLMGMKGARVSHLKFKDLRLPGENLLGEINDGFTVVMDELDTERTTLAAGAVGYARAALEAAIGHSAEREQFGRQIRKFEGVSFKVADMETKLTAARLLTLGAARKIDKGLKATKEGAMAKLLATETAVDVAHQSLQILGGIGYTKESIAEQIYRDARLMMIGGGTAEIMRFIIQREVYREHGY